MVIYNRNTIQERLDNIEITVGLNKPQNEDYVEDDDNEYCGGVVPHSQLPSTVQTARVPLIEITCSNPIDGRYVTIKGTRKYMTLCEVQVYAEPSKHHYFHTKYWVVDLKNSNDIIIGWLNFHYYE